jgi:lipopolysaccharide transport system ATP-binding protein
VSDPAITFDGVWKKFSRGEDYDSLRDLIPAAMRRILKRPNPGELRRREFWALQNLSFTVHKGEAIAIVGHNGSGKSTTLKLMTGILRPNRGTVRLTGRVGALIEVGAGFHQDLTGRENVYLNGTILGLSRKEIDTQFDNIVDFSELHEFIDTPVKRYSSGMYARLGFSVAVHMAPDILLIDEVLAVGDIAFQQKCLDRIKTLKQRGTTIVFISHNMHAVREICPRVLVLERGVKVLDGEASEMVTAYLKRLPQRAIVRQSKPNDAPIVVRHVGFLDEHGRETESFRSGDALRVRIVLEAHARVTQPVIGLAFYSSDGTCLYGHNSKIDRWDVGDVNGIVEYEVVYQSVYLYPGHYLVSLAVSDATWLRDYVYEDRAYSFTVEGAISPGIGVIRWPHAWRRLAPSRSEHDPLGDGRMAQGGINRL